MDIRDLQEIPFTLPERTRVHAISVHNIRTVHIETMGANSTRVRYKGAPCTVEFDPKSRVINVTGPHGSAVRILVPLLTSITIERAVNITTGGTLGAIIIENSPACKAMLESVQCLRVQDSADAEVTAEIVHSKTTLHLIGGKIQLRAVSGDVLISASEGAQVNGSGDIADLTVRGFDPGTKVELRGRFSGKKNVYSSTGAEIRLNGKIIANSS